jgi:multiple sugar transport system ATP-binding protein
VLARLKPGERHVTLGVRPECLKHTADAEAAAQGGHCAIRSRVVVNEPLGAETLCTFDIGGQTVVARLAADSRLPSGTQAWLSTPSDKTHWFDAQTGVSLQQARSR